MPRIDRLGEPSLDGLDLVGIVARKLLDNVADADSVGAESMQDRAIKSAESGKVWVAIHQLLNIILQLRILVLLLVSNW
jgi:hypothetical protein